jgi:methylenetetrahydrofolate--tRNA-(uracil-5-)-methyltransferase
MNTMNPSLTEKLKNTNPDVIVIGGGLAGSECAWQLAERGKNVAIVEQRPVSMTPAHKTAQFGELVCSNSLKSLDPESAPALLKNELSELNSLIMQAAYKSQVPAGQALAVDRDLFSRYISEVIEKHPKITTLRAEIKHFEEALILKNDSPVPIVIATGPLTSDDFARSLEVLVGTRLYFYDAIAPIVSGNSIDRNIAFEQNRYDKGLSSGNPDEGDYLNCPLNENEYSRFIEELGRAEKLEFHSFEKAIYFQGCQPIEALLEKGPKTLAFGPMKPVGLKDPRTGDQPFAVLQLRKEDSEGRAWNMVGFQTKLKYPEQKRVFSLIPGLENAEFYRFGSLHRNTYISSPALLGERFQLKTHPHIYFAGQITGVEGYLESTAIGALVGLQLCRQDGVPLPPATTALGALAASVIHGRIKNFQPFNINWGIVPLAGIEERDKDKKSKMIQRAKRQFSHWKALF